MRAEVVQKRADEIVAAMPDDFHPDLARFQAEREEDIARLLGAHRPVTYADRQGTRCLDPGCEGIVMQNMMDVYRHQAAVIWADGP